MQASDEVTDHDTIVRRIRSFLSHSGATGQRWLLVFDNAISNQAGAPDIRDALPDSDSCDVLITSRQTDWSDVAATTPVRPLEKGDAIEFLLKRSGRSDREGAALLADDLGYLPLALEQAGAFLATRDLDTFEYYRQRLSLTSLGDVRGRLAGNYDESVATTWLISMEALREESPDGAELLTLCAFLAPEAIPLDVLIKHAESLPDDLNIARVLRDNERIVEGVAAIDRYAFAEIGSDSTLYMHRLIQLMARETLAVDDRREWADSAVTAMWSAFPADRPWSPEFWPFAEPIAPHATQAARHREALNPPSLETGYLLANLGLYYQGRVMLGAAQEHQQRALAIEERVYGPDHAEVAITLTNLGVVLESLNEMQPACESYSRALAIFERVLPPSHHYTELARRNAESACTQ
jgi:hypothetical protein